jgi:hypothetical protein
MIKHKYETDFFDEIKTNFGESGGKERSGTFILETSLNQFQRCNLQLFLAGLRVVKKTNPNPTGNSHQTM